MNLQMNAEIAGGYTSDAQKMRVMTEGWVSDNLYCPFCGHLKITYCENHGAVSFCCPNCGEQFELKSKNGELGDHIAVGAYDTMIQRIHSENNPNFFFMHYNRGNLRVKDVVMVPKYFLVPEIIEKRKPLSDQARQAGWSGCNIRLSEIPTDGKILIVKNEEVKPMDQVMSQVARTKFISQYNLSERGWLLDVLYCVDKVGGREFTPEDVCQFEETLSQKHPDAQQVRDKIQQQMQILAGEGIIETCGDGHYRKHDRILISKE